MQRQCCACNAALKNLGPVLNCCVRHVQPCAKVWASGFASALLPRRSSNSEFRQNVYAWMECFFEQWLKGSPGIRLQQLARVLQKYQTFPQLYIYSESDHVVPHTSVEAFMEVTFKRLGCNWKLCCLHSYASEDWQWHMSALCQLWLSARHCKVASTCVLV